MRTQWPILVKHGMWVVGDTSTPHVVCRHQMPRGGTQYQSGYRDVPQTWVAKSGRQVHQWVFFFQKHGTLMGLFFKILKICAKMAQIWYFGQLFKIFRNLRQNGANFSEKFWFLVHGWVTFPSKWVHGWVAFQKSQRHTPTQTKVEYPPGPNAHIYLIPHLHICSDWLITKK